jgi:hypothetical protein
MIPIEDAIAVLQIQGDAQSAEMKSSTTRPSGSILCRTPRLTRSNLAGRTVVDDRLALAADLWDSNVHEACVAAAKLLVQARIIQPTPRALIMSVPKFDTGDCRSRCGAGAPAVCGLSRLDVVEAGPRRSYVDSVPRWSSPALDEMNNPAGRTGSPRAHFRLGGGVHRPSVVHLKVRGMVVAN